MVQEDLAANVERPQRLGSQVELPRSVHGHVPGMVQARLEATPLPSDLKVVVAQIDLSDVKDVSA